MHGKKKWNYVILIHLSCIIVYYTIHAKIIYNITDEKDIYFMVDRFYEQNQTYHRLRRMKREELLRRGGALLFDVQNDGETTEPTHDLSGTRIIGSIDLNEEKEFQRLGTNSIYGEISPVSIPHILKSIDVHNKDDLVMYDLGSGLGRVVLQSALSSKMKKLVGIELSYLRYKTGCNV